MEETLQPCSTTQLVKLQATFRICKGSGIIIDSTRKWSSYRGKVTLRERKSRYLIAIKNLNKEASGTALTLINALKNIKKCIKSITFDQGSEFNKYGWIKDCLNTDIYFCQPASPYQKGTVENGNGIIRAELPRNFNIDNLKQKTLLELTNKINNQPLKCINYRTPEELFYEYSGKTDEN